jgi:neutral ceramidase
MVMNGMLMIRVMLVVPWVLAGLAAGQEPGGLRAGAATANITPLMGVPLDGAIMQIGPARDVHDELQARCLVLDDGETRLAFAVVDNTMISREVIDRAKALVLEHTGIAPERVLIAATHTHSTPRAVQGLLEDPMHQGYLDYLAQRISEGIRRAVNRLAPAKLGWGQFEEPRYVQNRRWFVEGAEARQNPFGQKGERVVMNPGAQGLIKPAGPVDPQVFVVSVQHADGRPLALLANYGLHYIGGIPSGTVSADYYGVFAEAMTRRLEAGAQDPPFVAMMSNGTSGDVNARNPAEGEQRLGLYGRMKQVGEDLAEGVQKVVKGIEHRGDLRLRAAAQELTLAVRRPDPERLAWAEATALKAKKIVRLSRPQIYAREALALAKLPPTVVIPLQVFRIGELAITAIPNEVFAETGLAIKAASPFPGSTFTMELANGYFGYLPTAQQHEWGGYETWPARSSLLEVQAETKIRAAVLELLARVRKP